MEMINIEYNGTIYEISFFGIKLFQVDNPNYFCNNFIKQTRESKFSNVNIFKNNTIVVSDFSKIEDLVLFNKSSPLFKEIIDDMENIKFYDELKVNFIKEKINNKLGFEILQEKNELQKIINNTFELNTEIEINKNTFLSLLKNNIFENRMTFVLCDISWLKIEDVSEFINEHNFIFVTNDFRKNVSLISHLESCVICNKNMIEILDYKKVLNYLELKMNKIINESTIDLFLKNVDSPASFYMFLLLKFIE